MKSTATFTAGPFKRSYWTAEDLATLHSYYQGTPPEHFNLNVLSRMLGRSRFSVSIKARKCGLTDQARPKGERYRRKAKTLELPWARWVKHPHPRGMLGKKHKPEVIAVCAESSRRMWEHFKATGTGLMSEENRQRQSDRSTAMNLAAGRGGHRYSRAHAGKRADLNNTYFRSRWEANVARYLNLLVKTEQIWKWEYEADTFWFDGIKRGTRSYTPDFKIWERPDATPYYWEVKGWMDEKSVTRMKRMKKYHPTVRVDLIDQKRYLGIKRTAAGLCPGWEDESKKATYAVRVEVEVEAAAGGDGGKGGDGK